MIILLVAAVLGLLPAAIAAAKGRSFVLWWIYGALLFIIALPHALLAKSANKLIDTQQAAAGNVQCPTCAEWIRPEARICRYCKTTLAPAINILSAVVIALALTVEPVPAQDKPQRPASVAPACQGVSTAACKLEFVGSWTGQWGDFGERKVRFDKDGTITISQTDGDNPKQTTWFVPDPESVAILDPDFARPFILRVSKSRNVLTLQHMHLSPMVLRSQEEAAAPPSTDISLPVSDPLTLLALAQKLDPKGVIVTLRSCFSVNGCGRPKSLFNITPDYDSVFTKIPSTRIIAGLRDCGRLEAVQNEFQMRDLDIDTRADVEEAAKSVGTRFHGIVLVGSLGKYDFNQQGFPVAWKTRVKIYAGRSHCRGQEITDYGNTFPRDFYVFVDPEHLPTFLAVPADKARSIVESPRPYGVQVTASVEARKYDKGILDIKGTGITTGWVFSGVTSLTQLAWISDGKIVEEIPLPPAATGALPQLDKPVVSLKVDSARVIGSDVNVRAQPSKSAGLATVLKPHTYVTVTGKSPDGLWSSVKVDNKVVGWILDTALLKNSMTEEEAAAISEAGQFENIEKPN